MNVLVKLYCINASCPPTQKFDNLHKTFNNNDNNNTRVVCSAVDIYRMIIMVVRRRRRQHGIYFKCIVFRMRILF